MKDGKLDFLEFSIAMWLINHCIGGGTVPDVLPSSLPSSIAAGGTKTAATPAAAASTSLNSSTGSSIRDDSSETEDTVDVTRITDAELANYDAIFGQADSDHDGFVTGSSPNHIR